jgi:hypothetical protein
LRTIREARARTSTTDPIVRLLFVPVRAAESPAHCSMWRARPSRRAGTLRLVPRRGIQRVNRLCTRRHVRAEVGSTAQLYRNTAEL